MRHFISQYPTTFYNSVIFQLLLKNSLKSNFGNRWVGEWDLQLSVFLYYFNSPSFAFSIKSVFTFFVTRQVFSDFENDFSKVNVIFRVPIYSYYSTYVYIIAYRIERFNLSSNITGISPREEAFGIYVSTRISC